MTVRSELNAESRDNYLWLVSEPALQFLEESMTAIRDRINVLTIAKRLRRDLSPARSALVLELAQLRIRARRKFSRNDEMFFTRRAYEQSTGEALAHYKSLGFEGLSSVADICCGIGGDLIGLASRNGNGDTFGFDADFLCALFAKKNTEALQLSHTTVERKSFSEIDLQRFRAVHIDPDRRARGRTVNADFFEPAIGEILDKLHLVDNWGIKVAPATRTIEPLPEMTWREWIGTSRECKQQMIWLGELAQRPRTRTATVVRSDGRIEQFSNDPDDPPPVVVQADEIVGYLYEPHPTVLAAGLSDAMAELFDLARLSPGISYFVSRRCVGVPVCRVFRIEHVLPFSIREVGTKLRELEVGRLDIKYRGISKHDAEQFARIKLAGENSAILVLARFENQRVALLVRPEKPSLVDPKKW